jgi:hypothetical protein
MKARPRGFRVAEVGAGHEEDSGPNRLRRCASYLLWSGWEGESAEENEPRGRALVRRKKSPTRWGDHPPRRSPDDGICEIWHADLRLQR